MKKVRDFEIRESMDSKAILKQMEELGGFQGNKVAEAVNVLERMIKDDRSLNFISFPASLVATGIRGIFREMIKRRWFDLVITTCGTLDHDLARSWGHYYQGSFELDDEEVKKRGYSRLGSVLVPDEVYAERVEEKVQEFLGEIYIEKKELATYELVWEFGKRLKAKDSIIYWATKNKIPIIVPGITDGMIGYQLWMFSQDKDFMIDVLKDEQLLNDRVWEAERSGALIVGGGISKHHTIWWNQFRGGLDYAVYLTSAIELDGSLSGATPREAVSWGKINEKAEKVFIWGEATSILPLMVSALATRI
jgi:deoxyhypusine synthase